MFGDTFGCRKLVCGRVGGYYGHIVGRERPGIPLNILQCAEQLLTTVVQPKMLTVLRLRNRQLQKGRQFPTWLLLRVTPASVNNGKHL